jgi:hypothetical protein
MTLKAKADHIPAGQPPLWILLYRIDVVYSSSCRGLSIPLAFTAHVFISAQYLLSFAFPFSCLI